MATESFKISGIDTVLSTLQELPAEVVSKNGGVVKLALKDGANVILKQVKANLEVVTNNQTKSETQENTGLLLSSAIAYRRRERGFSGGGEAYRVGFRRKLYERKGKKVSTRKTAQLLEYGSSKQPAEPFIRTAFEAKKNEAVNVTVESLKKRIDRITAKMLKGRR